jgi:hypothetical protein
LPLAEPRMAPARGAWRLALALASFAALLGCAVAQGSAESEPVHRHALDSFAVHSVRAALDSRVTLRCNATRLARSGSWVEVSWTFAAGAPAPSKLDLLAYYVPADANISTKAPVKFLNATGGSSGTLRCAPAAPKARCG